MEKNRMNAETEELIEKLKLRTENYYEAHRLCCSEAIMYVFNQGLNGGVDDDAVKQLGSGFCGGMGGGDGTCGALTGAVAVLGLLLGGVRKGRMSATEIRKASKNVHDLFKEELGAIICKELTDAVKDGSCSVKNCRQITGKGAEIAARVILEHRPELAAQVDGEFVGAHDSRVGVWAKKIRSLLAFN